MTDTTFIDEKFMRRALQLASLGEGNVSPNPMVGAVVVVDGKIIGEGFHRICGEAHAEVNAINSVKDKSLLEKSTLYVTLEPCSHWGKTPPCSKLIIEKKIPNVVIGTLDPFPEVSGRGVKMLNQAGVNVKSGILEKECKELNKIFFTSLLNQRPYVILKWAQTADGYMDRHREEVDDKPLIISNQINSIAVHKLRSEVDAIMVGTTTAEKDNPSLTVRRWDGKNPVRVFLDKNLRVNSKNSLLDGSVPTLVFTEKQAANRTNVEYITVQFNSELINNILFELNKRNIRSLMVEGGAKLLSSFIEKGLWDEARVETSMISIENGVEAPLLKGKIDSVCFDDESLVNHYRNRVDTMIFDCF
ncbi:MAG: bifunctional diaminohydroxyphosphoribosylaminopyrimidine deaminase/5-amino-6-(5-phosphoribosylamino)uracil reductase RibD [Bacteroidales bacterium]|nr:bifunctional diaminohydroxyphosphoribosylaminopyrimidine deaminase/5-amino-6-(5-phosphoribosylamino)uracil reductase RibD [Bacteroidales bacterium]